jgi:hypothetical protein
VRSGFSHREALKQHLAHEFWNGGTSVFFEFVFQMGELSIGQPDAELSFVHCLVLLSLLAAKCLVRGDGGDGRKRFVK